MHTHMKLLILMPNKKESQQKKNEYLKDSLLRRNERKLVIVDLVWPNKDLFGFLKFIMQKYLLFVVVAKKNIYGICSK